MLDHGVNPDFRNATENDGSWTPLDNAIHTDPAQPKKRQETIRTLITASAYLGDLLVSKDVFDAIEMANNYDLGVSLYTNGALLDEERGYKLLDVLKNGRIVLSMQDIIPDTFHERLNGYRISCYWPR